MIQYIPYVYMEECESCDTFKDAVTLFLEKIRRGIENKVFINEVYINYACWIERVDESDVSGVLHFREVQSLAFQLGIIDEKSDVKNISEELDEERLKNIFLAHPITRHRTLSG